MELIQKINSVPRLKKALVWVLSFFSIFTITGFLILPPLVRSVLVKSLSEQLHREVSVRQVSINPFVLSLDIKGFLIRERGRADAFISFDELYLNLQGISLFKQGLVLSEIKLVRPYLKIVRSEEKVYNFSDLLPREEAKPVSHPDTGPFRFSLNNIQILKGRIEFEDGPKKTKHTVADMDVTVPFVSNLPYYVDEYVQPYFSAMVNDTHVSFRGKTKPFADSLETTIEIDFHDFDIPYYLAYVPVKMDFRVLSGFVDAKDSISYTQYRNRKPSLHIAGDVVFKKIKVADNQGGQMFSLPRIEIGIAKSELTSMQVRLSKVLVESPEIDVVMDKKGRVNLMSLIPESPAKKETRPADEKKESAGAFAIDADELKLTGGKVLFADFSRQDAFSTTLDNMEIKVDHFSNAKDKKTAVEVSFKTEAGGTFTYKSELSVDPLASSGTVEVKGIRLKKYAPYYEEMVLFDVEDAALDVSTGYMFEKNGAEYTASLSNLSSTLTSMRMRKRDDKKDFLKIPVMSIKDAGVDLTKREIVIGEFSTQKGELQIKRLKDGGLNIASLMAPTENKGGGQSVAKAGRPDKPWLIKMKKIEVDGYKVNSEDLVPADPVSLVASQIKFRGENISTAKNSKGKASLSLHVGDKGTIAANGTFGIEPQTADLKINVKELDITPFQPYFQDKVRIIMTSGMISAEGAFSVSNNKDSGLKAVYKGEASLSRLATVDKINADDFLKWDSLFFSGMDVGYSPLHVDIAEVALTDFYSRIIINPDGTLNLQGIMEGEATSNVPAPSVTPVKNPGGVLTPAVEQKGIVSSKTPAQKENLAKPIKIGKVTFQGGTVNFTDNFIKPNYQATLLEIGGRVSGLSSDETTLADVDLKGKFDNYAPFEITGKINPLKEDLFVDLKVDSRDMDLSPVTPYSGKYAGYTIQKGKLTLSLKYLIVNKKLEAQNNIFLDQFSFGDKVDSPDATKLPVRLAVALLKNRKGEIKLDIPVSGQIDDPKFSVGRIILKIIINLLVKAATSPFALLGALFGGGEELSYLDFDYGSFDIPEAGAKKLDTLVKALSDRPSLKLDIEGYVDTEKDREGLRLYLFNKKLKAQKLKEMVSKGLEAIPVDDIKVEKDEYPKYLKMAYKAEKFPKPRNIIGIAKDIPVAEMEKLMLTHIEVKDDDLRHLASERAMKVKDYILKAKQVEPERVFLLEPKALQPEKNEKMKNSRVDFKLK